MTMTFFRDAISFSPDTLDIMGNKPLCRLLVSLEKKALYVEPFPLASKDVVDIRRPLKGKAFITMLRELYHLNDEIPLVFEGRPTIIGAEFDLDHPQDVNSAVFPD